MNNEFWLGKRVFLTGHTGFKGAWLSLWLQQLGAEVAGYSLEAPTNPNLFSLAGVSSGMKSVIGDVRNLENLEKSLLNFKPEIVFHLAAQPLVRYSYDNPVETYSTNVMGTVHLLEAIRKCKSVRSAVIVTSDKCYENQEWVWGYRENEPLGGYDPYSNSKGCSELVTSAYRQSYFSAHKFQEHKVGLASARAGNVIGGGDWALDRLIPDAINSILRGEVLSIRNPKAIRPWQHVLEPLSGYLTLAERLYLNGSEFAEAWNFGPSDEGAKPVSWVVDHLLSHWERKQNWESASGGHPHEAQYLKLDCSKAKMKLGWHPQWTLEKTLESIAIWYKSLVNGDDMKKVTLMQIEEYSSALRQSSELNKL